MKLIAIHWKLSKSIKLTGLSSHSSRVLFVRSIGCDHLHSAELRDF